MTVLWNAKLEGRVGNVADSRSPELHVRYVGLNPINQKAFLFYGFLHIVRRPLRTSLFSQSYNT